jgi:predicted transcriptional regulator
VKIRRAREQATPVETQNVTLALPKKLLRRVKHLAVERDTSLSGLLRQFLEDMTQQDDAYERARRRWLEAIEHPRNLGTGGTIPWTREALHERR